MVLSYRRICEVETKTKYVSVIGQQDSLILDKGQHYRALNIIYMFGTKIRQDEALNEAIGRSNVQGWKAIIMLNSILR